MLKRLFNKQTIVLVTTKYLSYIINLAIVAVVVGGASTWIYLLYLSALE